jgi:MFS family permease
MGETHIDNGDAEKDSFSEGVTSPPGSYSPKSPKAKKRVSFSEDVRVDEYVVSHDGDQYGDMSHERSDMSHLRKVILASMVGNVLEWYDFGVFAYFAPQIGAKFFPKGDSASSVLNAFAVFGGGFFFRPCGGLIFGHVGDKHGRKKALFLSVCLMAGSTFGMGCLPTYEDAGIIATIALVLMRITQGFSVGGEFVGSMIYAVECAPKDKQCFMGAICMVGAILGLTLGSLVGLIIHSILDPQQISSWGWRIPFLSGILIGVFAIWIRNGLHETNDFEESKHGSSSSDSSRKQENGDDDQQDDGSGSDGQVMYEKKAAANSQKIPLVRSMMEHPVEILIMFIVSGCHSTGVWILTAFPPALYQDLMKPPLGYPRDGRRGEGGAMFNDSYKNIWMMHTALNFVPVISIGVFGYLGDSVGNVKMMMIGTLCILFAAAPCLGAMGEGSYFMAALGQGSMNIVIGILVRVLQTHIYSVSVCCDDQVCTCVYVEHVKTCWSWHITSLLYQDEARANHNTHNIHCMYACMHLGTHTCTYLHICMPYLHTGF